MSVSDEAFRTALKRVAVLLKQADVPFALAGGYAAFARGGPENLHDVDFVVPEHDIAKAGDVLAENGFRIADPPEDWLVKAFDENEIFVDLIFQLAYTKVDQPLLDRADELAVESVLMPVLSSTDLIVGKISTLSEHACDMEPALRVSRALREQVDWDKAREWLVGSPYADAFLFLGTELGIIPPAQPKALQPETAGKGAA